VDLLLLPFTRGHRSLSVHALRAQPEPGRDIQAGRDGGDEGTRRRARRGNTLKGIGVNGGRGRTSCCCSRSYTQ
jgi:hypothetical protein